MGAVAGFGAFVYTYEKADPRQPGTLNDQRAPTPQGFDPVLGLRMAYLTLAAYEYDLSKITPAKGDVLKNGGEAYTVVKPLSADGKMLGFVAENQDTQYIVIRGSKNMDFLFMLASRQEIFSGDSVTTKYYAALWKALWPEIRPVLPEVDSGKRIIIAGHSVGTAIGDLLADRIYRETGNRPTVYGFAPEAPGNEAFASRFGRDGIKEYNFSNPYDLLDIDPQYRNGIPPNRYGHSLIHVSPVLRFKRVGQNYLFEYKVDDKYLPNQYSLLHTFDGFDNHRLKYMIDAYRMAFPVVNETPGLGRIQSIERGDKTVNLMPSPLPDKKIVATGQEGWLRIYQP